jgi:ABC-type multidrug transport system ATPase subunit
LEEVSYDGINEWTRLKDHQDFLYKLLTSKDSFIRKKIIDQNLQYLNYRLNYYLEKLGLPHDVRFNSDLSVDITEYGRDLDFDNLSRGERNRLILGMSWAFRDIYESLNQPMNLMCIDELVDSGMDTTGVEAALGVLKKMGRESKKNVFLISHKEELQGRVSNVLYVVKEGGFTSYANDIEILET